MFFVLLAVAAALATAQADCSCSNPNWCKPITAGPRPEVFAFHTNHNLTTVMQYDWSIPITTIGVYTNPIPEDLVCFAHSKQARVVLGTSFPQDQLTNQTHIAEWINSTLTAVQASNADGINLDIEGNSGAADALTAFTAQVVKAFHTAIPGSQVTFDSSIYPLGDTQGYHWGDIARTVDFLFIMAYDMCWGTKVAEANSPMDRVKSGLNDYIQTLKVPSDRLVLGLPWYGYNFPCTAPAPSPNPCTVKQPFGGGAWQVGFNVALAKAASTGAQILHDTTSLAAYFSYQDAKSGDHYQLWFDDEQTLAPKYALAKSLGLRGVGFWTADLVSGAPPNRFTGMWQTIRNFTGVSMQ